MIVNELPDEVRFADKEGKTVHTIIPKIVDTIRHITNRAARIVLDKYTGDFDFDYLHLVLRDKLLEVIELEETFQKRKGITVGNEFSLTLVEPA